MDIRAALSHPQALLVIALQLALVMMAGCTDYPSNTYGEISMDSWCDQDSKLSWTGCWEEVKQIDCDSGEEFESEEAIGEFRLRSDGVYSVTRHPFEHFVDYSGTYTVTETDATITFSPLDTSGFDGNGSYSISSDGHLVLDDVWFGIYSDWDESDSDPSAVSCGYVFRSDDSAFRR